MSVIQNFCMYVCICMYMCMCMYFYKYWVKTECTQTAYRTQIKNLYVKKRRKNLQILEYKKYLCNPPPPPRTNICLHKRYTNWNNDLLFLILIQSSGKRRLGGENFIWKSVRCLVALMVG